MEPANSNPGQPRHTAPIYWKCLHVQATDVAAVTLHFPQEFLSMFKSGNIIMPLLLFCQDEREGRRWPEEVNKGKECGLKIGDAEVKQESKLPHFNENFPKLECPSAPWLGLLFTCWCHICQALEESHVDLGEGQMVTTHDQIKLAKFKPDGGLTITWNMQSKNGSLHCPLFVDRPMIMTVDHHHGHDQFHMDLLFGLICQKATLKTQRDAKGKDAGSLLPEGIWGEIQVDQA